MSHSAPIRLSHALGRAFSTHGSKRKQWLYRWQLLVLICISQMVLASPVIANSFEREGIFGQAGKKFLDFQPVPKWSSLLKRFKAEEQNDQDCRRRGTSRCTYDRWKRTIDGLKLKSKSAQIRAVNEFANQWQYVADTTNWGQEDYWAIPGEFFRKAGDCEDYAFVKFMSLRALGFSNDKLRMVIVEDLKLNIHHTVILVELHGRVLQLDNQIDQVIPAETVSYYKPIYAVNENAWWLYP